MTILFSLLPYVVFVGLLLTLWLMLARVAPQVWRRLDKAGHFIAKRFVDSARFARFVGPVRVKLKGRGAYLPVVLILIAGAMIAFWSGAGFAHLAEMLRDNAPALHRVDTEFHDGVVRYRTPASTFFFVAATTIGGPAGLAVIVAIVSVLLVIKRKFRWLAYLLITAGGGTAMDIALKSYFHRQRPDLEIALRRAHGYSFPSGHAMGSMVVFSALAYLAVRALPDWNKRSFCLALASCLVLAVATSRVYLGVHWISDVAAGVAGGAVWAATTTAAYELFRQIRALRERRHIATK